MTVQIIFFQDLELPQESLTDPRDEGMLTFDTLERSWKYAIW